MQPKQINCVLSVLCFALFICSCSKPAAGDADQPSSKNPQALSAASKIWHGERVAGIAPSPRGSSIQLDAGSPLTFAFAGRFATINPSVATGDVKGYYVQFNGASEYFKVDYSKPRSGRLRAGVKQSNPFSRNARTDSTGGNADSAIVIALPANLQVPDTFCVSYCAFDAQGNISNVVTTCIIVNNLGTDANGSWTNGSWRLTSYRDSSWGIFDTIIHNRWYATNPNYYCDSNLVSRFDNGTPSVAADSAYYKHYTMRLGSNGAMQFEIDGSFRYVDFDNSTCSQIRYLPLEKDVVKSIGGWSFNSTTSKLTIVFDYSDPGSVNFEAWEYKLIKVSNNNFLLQDLASPPGYIRFEK